MRVFSDYITVMCIIGQWQFILKLEIQAVHILLILTNNIHKKEQPKNTNQVKQH